MSYCRFGSDDWRSDVYCYGAEYGYVTHVACNRLVNDIPSLPAMDGMTGEEWLAAYRVQSDAVDASPRVPIGLPHDGETFEDETLADFQARLLGLREMGYRVPQSALDLIEAEMAEEMQTAQAATIVPLMDVVRAEREADERDSD